MAFEEDVLRHLLGGAGVARDAERDAVDAALMAADDLLERRVRLGRALLDGGHDGFASSTCLYGKQRGK